MRNLKRFLALMLTVLMVAGCFALPTSAKATDVFDDVDQYTDAINALYALDIIKGTTATTFGTDEGVKRFQAALFFSRIMTGRTNDAVWMTGVNNTSFTDLGENPFINAISYVSNNGVVTGKTAVKFAPDDGITVEQLYTMGVRALGQETTAMKASLGSGLWAYIDKAITLGLDKGLEDITDYKKTATRGETAQFMYNLLFAETADGYTYAAKSFDLIQETFILAATNTHKYMIASANNDTNVAIAAPGYIGLATLASDGTLGKVYYITASEFRTLAGINADANLDDYIGYSFDIIADSTLDTVYEVSTNATKTYINDTDVTQVEIFNNGGGNRIVVDGVSYVAANKPAAGNSSVYTYTNNLWNVGVKNTGNNEVLVYDWSNAASSSTNGYYYYDASGNIVDKDGAILMYLTGVGTGIVGPIGNTRVYMVLDGNGTYRLPTAEDWAKATYYIQGAATQYYAPVANADAISSNNYYSEMKCFDDNGDGKWDRMFYTKYSFGQFIVDGGNRGVRDANGGTPVSVRGGMTVKGESASNGTWIAYAYNPVLNEIIIKKTYSSTTGYVNGFSVANSTITIDGITYAIGNLSLDGIITAARVFGSNAGNNWSSAIDDLIGRYVSFYKIANTIVVFGNSNVTDYVVYDGIISVTAENNISVKAYLQNSSTASIIKVASLNGYPLSSNPLSGMNTQLNYVYSTLLSMDRGTLLTTAVDVSGNYHLYEVMNAGAIDTSKTTLGSTNVLAGATNVLTFGDYAIARYTDNAATPATTAPVFQVNADTVFILVDLANNNGIIGTFKGVPAAGSSLTLGANSQILYRYGGNSLASFVYVLNVAPADMTGSFTATQFDGIVYIDAAATRLNNIFSDTFNGTVWEYSNAVNVATGAWTGVKAASVRLIAGNYYTVKDGYATQRIDLAAADSPIKEVKILSVEHTYFGFLTGAATLEGVANPVRIGSIIKIDGNVETSNGNIVSYNTLAFAQSLESADAYAKALAITTTVNGVETVNFILANNYIGSYLADYSAAISTVATYTANDTTNTISLAMTVAPAEIADIPMRVVFTMPTGGGLALSDGSTVVTYTNGADTTVGAYFHVATTETYTAVESDGTTDTIPTGTYGVKIQVKIGDDFVDATGLGATVTV